MASRATPEGHCGSGWKRLLGESFRHRCTDSLETRAVVNTLDEEQTVIGDAAPFEWKHAADLLFNQPALLVLLGALGKALQAVEYLDEQHAIAIRNLWYRSQIMNKVRREGRLQELPTDLRRQEPRLLNLDDDPDLIL